MTTQFSDLIFLHDQWFPAAQAAVPIDDRGLRFGDGVFETMRIENASIYQMEFHLARLFEGLQAFSIPEIDVTEILLQTIKKNNLCRGFLRLQISRGDGGDGYAPAKNSQPRIWARCFPMTEIEISPLNIWHSRWRSILPSQLPTAAKTLQAGNAILARIEAIQNNCGEALRTTISGNLSECSAGSLLWQKSGKLYTPSLENGALKGSIRHALLQRFPREINVGDYKLADLESADAVCILNVRILARAVLSLAPENFTWPESEKLAAHLRDFLLQDIAEQCV
jgi:branched-subunit amino acid aminotransferase/4-amino-4-deoxychorismate lyase